MEYPQRWLKEHNAIPSAEGWRRPTTKELLKSQKGLEDSDSNDLLTKIVKSISVQSTGRSNAFKTYDLKFDIKLDEDILSDEIIKELGGAQKIVNDIMADVKIESDVALNSITKRELGRADITFNDYEGDDEKVINVTASYKKLKSGTCAITIYKIPRLHKFETYPRDLYYFTEDIVNQPFDFTLRFEDFDYEPKNIELKLDYKNDGTIDLIEIVKDDDLYRAKCRLTDFVNKTQVKYKFIIDGIETENEVIITTPPPIDF